MCLNKSWSCDIVDVVCNQESVALLMSKLKLLDPTNLSDVELRLQVLGTRLEKLQKTQATVQDAGKQNKVRRPGLNLSVKSVCVYVCVRDYSNFLLDSLYV